MFCKCDGIRLCFFLVLAQLRLQLASSRTILGTLGASLGPSWPSLWASWGHLGSHHGCHALILMPYVSSMLPTCSHMMPTWTTLTAASPILRRKLEGFEWFSRLHVFPILTCFSSIWAQLGLHLDPSLAPLDPVGALLTFLGGMLGSS